MAVCRSFCVHWEPVGKRVETEPHDRALAVEAIARITRITREQGHVFLTRPQAPGRHPT